MAKLHDLEVDDYLAKCVEIDDRDIDGTMRRHAAELAYWNGKLAGCLRTWLLAKLNVKQVRARLSILIRAELEDAIINYIGDPKLKPKNPTEAVIEARIEMDESAHEAEIALIEAQVAYENTKGSAFAVGERGNMLRSLGARLREELKGDPVVRQDFSTRRRVTAANEEADMDL